MKYNRNIFLHFKYFKNLRGKMTVWFLVIDQPQNMGMYFQDQFSTFSHVLSENLFNGYMLNFKSTTIDFTFSLSVFERIR